MPSSMLQPRVAPAVGWRVGDIFSLLSEVATVSAYGRRREQDQLSTARDRAWRPDARPKIGSVLIRRMDSPSSCPHLEA